MSEVQDTHKKNSKTDVSSGMMPITDIIFLTLHKWPWIILSIVVCVGITYFNLLRTPNVYTRSAELLIKDQGKARSKASDEYANLGLFKPSTNIPNEISNLKAKDLMAEVVQRLNLDINYYFEGRFRNAIIYGSSLPVKISAPDYPDESSFSLNLQVSSDSIVTISDLKIDGIERKDKVYKGRLNDSIATPLGKIMVSPTNNFKNWGDSKLLVTKIPFTAARDSYNGRLGVTLPNEDGSVLKITMADQSTERADDVINALIEVYNENWIHDRNQIALSTSDFITERLGVIEHELGNVDSDISSYKSANLIPDVNAAASMYMGQSQQNQAQILELNNQLTMARYIRTYLTADSEHNQLLPVNTGLQSSNVQTLIGEYNSTLLQRNSLVAKSSEKNPLVIQLDERLTAQRQAIIRTIDNEIIALNTQLSTLRGSEAKTMSHLASNPTQAKNLLSIERQQKVKEALYLFLLQKREENELSQAFTAYNTRVINKPGASGVPVTPNRSQSLLIAFFVGLALPFGLTYLKEMTNTKIRGRKDVENLVVPFLGEIPEYASKSSAQPEDHTLLVKAGKRNIINEAFRVLRTNVQFMCNNGAGDGGTVIALTSFNPGSGKSFISMNLGKSIALKDKKVLVVDGDMRHGSTSAYVDSPSTGMANYLSGAENSIDPLIVQDSTCESLFILPVGPMPPNPTELLESPRFAELIKYLKTKFDYIIIDCPPIEVVADAQIIDQYADRTFFILRAGLLERSMIPELDRLYEEKKFRNMAFILNGTRNDQGRYGYSHSYRYGYGYGYGYGYNYGTHDDKKKTK